MLVAAIALSAPGEYHLAREAGWSAWVAWLMPFTISVYAAAAAALAASRPKGLRASAIVGSGFALLLALAAQVVAHLLASGHIVKDWWLIAIVSAIPPVVVAHVLHLAATPGTNLAEQTQDEPETADLLAPLVSPAVSAWIGAAPPTATLLPLTPLGIEQLPEQPEQDLSNPAQGRLLTTREVARRFGVKSSTVGTWKERGKISPTHTDPRLGNLYDPEALPALASLA
ncbi:hypothetical protein ACFQ8O_26470 [Streptomyces coelicoflavus]|uniref:hypothetical protein n=1 Tax=Streptomyces coelicoflavus TaxID=285562 RepID=UPI00369A797F